jgi:pimeloyl-ACP methyl ester carboxylesterase
MATYVLVHGAWGGGFTWRYVRPILRDAGHDVYTPTLTGLGERVHLASPSVDLSTHALDVANTILYQDLDQIVLVGYSYGGMVVTAALEHVAPRTRHLIYLDAFVPRDGESLYSMTGQPLRHAGLMGSEWLVPYPSGLFGEQSEAWFEARMTPHPAGCFEEPVHLPRPLEEEPFTRTFVKATVAAGPGGNTFLEMTERYRDHPAWQYREVAATHHFVRTHPKEVAEILLEATSS